MSIMSKRKMSSRYDPMVVKAKVAKRVKEAKALGRQFLSAIKDITEEDLHDVIANGITNDSIVELALTALLGLKGIEACRFA